MRDIWVVSRFAFKNEAAGKIHEPTILFLNLGVEMLGHGETVTLTLYVTTTQFSKVVWPIYLPTSNDYEFYYSTNLPAFGIISFFSFSHSHRCVAGSDYQVVSKHLKICLAGTCGM